MAIEEVKWDIMELTSIQSFLSKNSNKLISQYMAMQRLKAETAVHWDSPAGREYQGVLDHRMKQLEKIILAVQDQQRALDAVIKKCYQACEDEISRAASNLRLTC